MPGTDPKDLAFIVWMNPDHPAKPQSRLLVTHFAPNSGQPLAFFIKNLQNSAIFSQIPLQTPKTLAAALLDSTAHHPVIIPADIATSQLGWDRYVVSYDTFGA